MSIADLPFAGSPRPAHRRLAIALAAVAAALACLAGASPASAVCPNEVFRTGPAARLPDCRAYELVSPAYTGGLKPSATNFSNIPSAFEFPVITDSGDSVVFNTIGGALSGTPGNGWADKYVAKRTPEGWRTEFIGATSEETPRATPGGVSADHQYYFMEAGFSDFYLEPEATLQKAFGGKGADYIRLPGGKWELIGIGKLGIAEYVHGRLITPGATHIIFSTSEKLEPNAGELGEQIYDRTPGGPTKVVSLLPGDQTPTGETKFLGVSTDGNDVVFADAREPYGGTGNTHWFVRRDNQTTKEIARTDGAVVGKKLTCTGEGGTSQSYQWLRNGEPIGGATGPEYTVAPTDAGKTIQCQVKVTSSAGGSIRASLPPLVVPPYEGIEPPYHRGNAYESLGATVQGAYYNYVGVGETVTCSAQEWDGGEGGSPTFVYRWYRNGDVIPGESGATYTATGADEGAGLQCGVTATNADGAAVGMSPTYPVRKVPAYTLVKPAITDTTDPGDAPELGDQLSCSQGTWSNSPTSFAYSWYRDGAKIGGATASTYIVGVADAGKTLQCAVTATNPAGETRAISIAVVADPQPGTAPPALPAESFWEPGTVWGGAGIVGESLYCYPGEWNGEPTFSYQWLRDGEPIGGATGENYVLTAEDLETVVQCQLTATNAGGSVTGAASWKELFAGPRYVMASQPPDALVSLPSSALAFAGITNGHVFFADGGTDIMGQQEPADLFSYDIASGTTTQITHGGDALFSHVSDDASHVYFVTKESTIGGEGTPGKPNLYYWRRSDESTHFIATVEPKDLELQMVSQGGRQGANLASWVFAEGPEKESIFGLASSYTRSSADGSVFLFETTAPLQEGFNNVESTPEKCLEKTNSGDRCQEAYLYDTNNGELTCVSCPPGKSGPATGHVSFYEWWPITDLNRPNNLSADGTTVFFESSEDLLPRDRNERRDVYRWKKGSGLALISTGQEITNSYIYGITPNGNDVTFITTQQLLPEDENGGTERIYDARVDGGFPPPESTVTEPCSGDACQGNPAAAPESASIASSSLNGAGNVDTKLRCPKGTRRVRRHGKERCVVRRHRHHGKHRNHRHHGGTR